MAFQVKGGENVQSKDIDALLGAMEKQERVEGVFVCSQCVRRSEFATPEAAAAVAQYLLLPKPICPECSYETVLEPADRNRSSFFCENCSQEIFDIEE